MEDTSVMGVASRRRKQGISLQQIADATKIGVRLLQAIEDGDFSKLPGGIYNTSYIRQYCNAIGFDEATLLDVYHERTGAPKPCGTAPSSQPDTPLVKRLRPLMSDKIA